MGFEQQVHQCWFFQRMSLEYSIFLSQAALKAAKQSQNERDEDVTALRVEIQVGFDGSMMFFPPFNCTLCLIWSIVLVYVISVIFVLSEPKRWCYSSWGTTARSWSWSKGSSDNDTENDFDPWRNGLFFLLKWELTTIQSSICLNASFYLSFRRKLSWRDVGLPATGVLL